MKNIFKGEILVLTPKRHIDNRGFFAETWRQQNFLDLNLELNFVQDNHSVSLKTGTLRGLHFQSPPHAQAKLVRCGKGMVFDVVVDIRKGSPSYGMWNGYHLSSQNGRQLYIPKGFAHGFLTLEPESEIIYKCTDYYVPETEKSLRWNDPDLRIQWPTYDEVLISEKDAKAPLLSEIDSPFYWEVG